MRFGLFGGATAKATQGNDSQIYSEFIDYVVEAEELGFESVFLVEHHFTGMAQVSATLTFLAYLAARTKKMRLGTAVTVLPWHNPVLLAEQAATVDLVSGGRLDLGIGRGYRYSEYAGFCMPFDEGSERYAESIEVIRKAWTSTERFSHHGKYWNFDNIIVEPPPVQKPHPPLWVGAASERSIRAAAEGGFNLLLDQLATPQMLGERVGYYRDALAKMGQAFDPRTLGVTRALHVAMTQREREWAYEMRAKFLLTVHQLSSNPNAPPSAIKPPTSLADVRIATEEAALIGTPEEIIARIKVLEAMGIEYLLLLDVTSSIDALRVFAREVMPAFKESKATQVA
ncbi:MAG TPA: LLM class flavin-dependent oxidoreductase [Xanthobacteraceae bacterium]|nr:LLM class flavin-dependent oxidoreductase [Xanthobacteraceae bacterium]